METLWIETENTIKVRDEFRKYDSRSIVVKDIKVLKNHPKYSNLANYLGVNFPKQDKLLIYVDREYAEAVIVHEILHSIMMHENFPQIQINQYLYNQLPTPFQVPTEDIKRRFQNTIDHIEILRKMKEEYILDIDRYFLKLCNIKFERFQRGRSEKFSHVDGFVFREQQHILEGIDYFNYIEPYKEKIFNAFSKTYPNACLSCKKLFTIISKIGFTTPLKMREVANQIQQHIIEYGEPKFMNNIFKTIWKSLLIK